MHDALPTPAGCSVLDASTCPSSGCAPGHPPLSCQPVALCCPLCSGGLLAFAVVQDAQLCRSNQRVAAASLLLVRVNWHVNHMESVHTPAAMQLVAAST